MTELNPHHPVTEKMHDSWHKICGILLMRLGLSRGSGEIVITLADVNKLSEYKNDIVVVMHDRIDGIHLKLVTIAKAEALTKKDLQ